MIQLDPEDQKEAERAARAYAEAFRAADADKAVALSVLPMVDCVDVGSRCGVYMMDREEFEEHVRQHEHENFTTEVMDVVIEPLGKNAALARVDARVCMEHGALADIEWVELLARTEDGWKVWANWLGPLPEGFWPERAVG